MGFAQFGLQAGSPNYAQGGVPGGGYRNRFAYSNLAFKEQSGQLWGWVDRYILPTFAPFAWAWTRRPSANPSADALQPEDAIAPGAMESKDRDLWGDFYYGYHADLELGQPEREDASYADVAYGMEPAHALHDPSARFWPSWVPNFAFPRVKADNRWTRAAGEAHRPRGRSSHYGGVHYR